LESIKNDKTPQRILCVVDVYSHQSKWENISLFRVWWELTENKRAWYRRCRVELALMLIPLLTLALRE
jgi:hypothetical protein